MILTDPIRALKLRSLANAVSAHVKALLQAATVVDRTAATALAAALGLKVDDFDLGPLDLSPEGLQDQAFNTSQGSVGFCAWLTPLMSTYTDDPTYLSIYSQALRQAYPDITSSNFELTAKIVLGPGNYVETQAANTSFDSIRQTLEADPPGAVMVATTNAPEQQPDNMPDDKKLQGGHAYSVTGFTPDGRIILKNPHGPGRRTTPSC